MHDLTLEIRGAFFEHEVDIAHPRRVLHHALQFTHVIESKEVLLSISTRFPFILLQITVLGAQLLEPLRGLDATTLGAHQTVDICAQVCDKALKLRHLSVPCHITLALATLQKATIVGHDVPGCARYSDA